jgi:hypothetical protein
MTFSTEIEKSTLKFIWKHKRPSIAKAILSKKEQCWKFHNSQLQTIYTQSNSNKNSMVLAQEQNEDLRNRIEDQDMNPCNYAHLIFDKVAKTYDGEKTASSISVARITGYLPAEI